VASEYDIALEIFQRFEAAFPSLRMDLDLAPGPVDLAMWIPAQDGLTFAMALNLQNGDELYITTENFNCSWFPCTRPDVSNRYCEAVLGLLSGRYRILEHFRRRRVAKAELQRPKGTGWETVATSGIMLLPWLREGVRVVQNVAAAYQGLGAVGALPPG
jgi:hypothetical protein